jgi:hypothetical protein
MAVRLSEIVFANRNSIDVSLRVEAPVGRIVVDNHKVPALSTYRVAPGIDDCGSVLLAAGDDVHGVVQQAFVVARPAAGQPSYISHLAAHHVVGSILGTLRAQTEGAEATGDEFLRDVERDESGQIIQLSRWGWKKVVLDGKRVLVAATRDEALAALKEAGERDAEAMIDGCASRDPNNLNCYNTGACKKRYCITRSFDTGIRLCVCTDSTG